MLLCAAVFILNLSSVPWTKKDKQVYRSAQVRCKAKYPMSPCIKKFIKVKPQTYRVICGPAKENKK